nr:hypothetical protein [Tanacetum cinerariifolium]
MPPKCWPAYCRITRRGTGGRVGRRGREMRKPKRGSVDQVDVLVSTIQKEIMSILQRTLHQPSHQTYLGDLRFSISVMKALRIPVVSSLLEYEHVVYDSTSLERDCNTDDVPAIRQLALKDKHDSPCLLVLIIGTSQSRQQGKSESDSYYLSDYVVNSYS